MPPTKKSASRKTITTTKQRSIKKNKNSKSKRSIKLRPITELSSSNRQKNKKRKRSLTMSASKSRKSASKSRSRKRRRVGSRPSTHRRLSPTSVNIPYIVYHENKINDPSSISDSYRPIIVINTPLFSDLSDTTTAYYKSSGKSNDKFSSLYSNTWFPIAGIIESSGYTKNNGEVLGYGFILKMETIPNVKEIQSYKWVYDLIVEYFDSVTPEQYKEVFNVLKPSNSENRSKYYENVRTYLIRTTDDNLNYFEKMKDEYTDIYNLLKNYFLNIEQVYISAHIGDGYWKKNVNFCNYIVSLQSAAPYSVIAENAKRVISAIDVPMEGTTGHNTQEVIDFLKLNKAQYDADMIKQKTSSIDLVPYNFYTITITQVVEIAKRTRAVMSKYKK